MEKTSNRPLIIAAICVFGALITLIVFQIIQNNQNLEKTPGEISTELGLSEREKWPIIDQLPIKNSLYTIGYTIKNNDLKIYIDTTDTYLEVALKKLGSLADKPLSNYAIEIRTPENPFKGRFVENSIENPLEFFQDGYKDAAISYEVTSTKSDNDNYLIYLTTGSEEAYNLVHYTAVLEKSGDGWKLVTEPTPTLLLDQ